MKYKCGGIISFKYNDLFSGKGKIIDRDCVHGYKVKKEVAIQITKLFLFNQTDVHPKYNYPLEPESFCHVLKSMIIA